MKNSGLFIGLGVGLLVGASIGLFFASSEEDKAELADDIKAKVDEAKKGISKVVKQGLEELDKAIETINQATKDTISKMGAETQSESESEPAC